MKKVILIDGNNLLFRSYYATAYSGSILRNSKGFPTNALYGFINMLNKIINEEKPSYMMIAFDKGKTFRHEKYEGYKDGRKQTPLELNQQFPVAKEIARTMGIKCFEIDNYEADDIIGTFAKEVDKDDDFIATIVSSDKDLLQLISNDVEVKLLKTNDYIRMNEKTFFDTYGITPPRMVDLKSLMGDPSDNIPGVKGIGEKTALKLLHEYKTLDGIYENIDSIKGSTKNKLEESKKDAYFSYELATIYKDVPIDTNLSNIKYEGITEEYIPLLEEYEFYSIIKKLGVQEEVKELEYEVKDNISIDGDFAYYILVNGNYHDKDVIGIGIYNDDISCFIDKENFKNLDIFNNNNTKYTYDLKKNITLFKYFNIPYNKNNKDLVLETYLLNYNIKDDISYLTSICGKITTEDITLLKKKDSTKEDIMKNTVSKAKFIWDNKTRFYEELNNDEEKLYLDIELPLTYVLSDMEYTGVNMDLEVLNKMKEDLQNKLEVLTKDIYTLAGVEFNILSPKQLGTILFEKLSIPYPKKVKNDSYSTSADILNKLTNYEIVEKVLTYRMLAKLYSNYAVGLIDYIKEDGRIHTIFNQTLTRTGRLSSTSPNLQNIPMRTEYGRMIRKAFIPSNNGYILSSDYSQIELRVFAHMSNATNLIEAFNNDMDIHTKTAMDIYHVPKEEVTPLMRRNAKAVNFGIIYGISSFGLSEDLNINVKEAKDFIDNYLNTFPGIKDYMENLKQDAYQNGYVKTLFGRTRVIDELKNSNYMIRQSGERMALNTPIQGTSADILKKAMIEIYDLFSEKKLKSKMIIQVHDELVFDVYKDEKEVVEQIVKEKMENVYKLNVPLKADINIGTNWYEAK